MVVQMQVVTFDFMVDYIWHNIFKDVLHSYLCIAFIFNGGQLPALTIHPIETRVCMVHFNGPHYVKSPLQVYSKRVSSDMYMEYCFLTPWA